MARKSQVVKVKASELAALVSGIAQRARLPPNERPGQSEVDTRGRQAYRFAQG